MGSANELRVGLTRPARAEVLGGQAPCYAPAVAQKRSPYKLFAGMGVLLTAGIAGALVYFTDLSAVVVYLIAISVAAFFLCGYDKMVSGAESLRVPETVLLGSALVGGTLGLLVGMSSFRHKTRKRSFQLPLLVIVLLQVAAVGYFGYNYLKANGSL